MSSLCRTATGSCSNRRLYGAFLSTAQRLSSPQFTPAHHYIVLQATKCSPSAVKSGVRESTRTYSSQSKDVVFSDPYRPDLFYHLLNPPNPLAQTLPAFGLSFLYERPPSADSAKIIGWLPAQLSESASDSEVHTDIEEGHDDHSTLQDFRENRECYSVSESLPST